MRAGLERSLKLWTAGGMIEDRSDAAVGEALEELWLERGMAADGAENGKSRIITQVGIRFRSPLAHSPLSMTHSHARAEEVQPLQSCRVGLRKGDFSPVKGVSQIET